VGPTKGGTNLPGEDWFRGEKWEILVGGSESLEHLKTGKAQITGKKLTICRWHELREKNAASAGGHYTKVWKRHEGGVG